MTIIRPKVSSSVELAKKIILFFTGRDVKGIDRNELYTIMDERRLDKEHVEQAIIELTNDGKIESVEVKERKEEKK